MEGALYQSNKNGKSFILIWKKIHLFSILYKFKQQRHSLTDLIAEVRIRNFYDKIDASIIALI